MERVPGARIGEFDGSAYLDDLFGDSGSFLTAVAKWATKAGVDALDLYSILVHEARGLDNSWFWPDSFMERNFTIGKYNDTHGPSNLGWWEFDSAMDRGNLDHLIPARLTRRAAWNRLSRSEYLEIAVAATAYNLQERIDDAAAFIGSDRSDYTADAYAVMMYRTGLQGMENDYP